MKGSFKMQPSLDNGKTKPTMKFKKQKPNMYPILLVHL